jgi:hypothetical protein
MYLFVCQYSIEHLVEAVRYKPGGCGFDSRWGFWDFSLMKLFRPHWSLELAQPITEMSSRDLHWGGGGKGGRCVWLTTVPHECTICLKILGASTSRTEMAFIFLTYWHCQMSLKVSNTEDLKIKSQIHILWLKVAVNTQTASFAFQFDIGCLQKFVDTIIRFFIIRYLLLILKFDTANLDLRTLNKPPCTYLCICYKYTSDSLRITYIRSLS